MNKLPSLGNVTLDDKDKITALYEQYEKMSDYEKTFVATDNVTKLKEYRNRIDELMKASEATGDEATTDKTEETQESSTTGEETETAEETVRTEGEEAVDGSEETEVSETVAESGSVESTEETTSESEGVSGEDETAE